MASNLKYAVALKNNRLAQITSAIGTSGLLSIYSGTQPTNPDTALSGNTLLAQLSCASTFAPTPSGGILTANTISSAVAGNNGTATWGSLTTSGSTRIIDFSVGLSGCDLNLNAVTIYVGASITVAALTITAAN